MGTIWQNNQIWKIILSWWSFHSHVLVSCNLAWPDKWIMWSNMEGGEKFSRRNHNFYAANIWEYRNIWYKMGAKDSKPSYLTYEDSLRRGMCLISWWNRGGNQRLSTRLKSVMSARKSPDSWMLTSIFWFISLVSVLISKALKHYKIILCDTNNRTT